MADNARDPEELEREIERTREDLAGTIDEIADRLSPRNVARRGVERAKNEAGQAATAVGMMVVPRDPESGEPQLNPRAVGTGAVVVVGLAVLILWRRGRRRRRY
jgi:uncharacterized protein DUF3618